MLLKRIVENVSRSMTVEIVALLMNNRLCPYANYSRCTTVVDVPEYSRNYTLIP
jgi:hypothetical protein